MKICPTQLTYSNPNPLYPLKHAYVLTVVSNILMKIPWDSNYRTKNAKVLTERPSTQMKIHCTLCSDSNCKTKNVRSQMIIKEYNSSDVGICFTAVNVKHIILKDMTC